MVKDHEFSYDHSQLHHDFDAPYVCVDEHWRRSISNGTYHTIYARDLLQLLLVVETPRKLIAEVSSLERTCLER